MNKAWLSEDGGLVTVQLKRPKNTIGKISVRVLGSNIVNSPLLHQFLNDENKDPTSHELTLANDSIGIFDMTGLDESDLASLDMTTRRHMMLSAGKQQLLANPTFQACQSPRRVSKQPNISSVPEVASLNQPSQLNSTTPFSPHSEGAVSTMRATEATSQLSVGCTDRAEGGSPTPDNSRMDHSILARSRDPALSMDDMQRSLSGNESVDKSVVQLDKSVSFAPKTQVVVTTVTNDEASFRVVQGQTKDTDGQAGTVRRMGVIPSGSGDIWAVDDVEDEDFHVNYNPDSAVTLPLVETDSNLLSSKSCIPSLSDWQEEDPHLMLNASKAPSPQSMKCWQKEDSIWDAVPDSDQEEDEDYDNDPHLMLNASKAPTGEADWSTFDPTWNSNVSLLPDACLNQSTTCPSATEDQNQTVWGEEPVVQFTAFDFLQGSLEVAEVYQSHPIAASSSRGTKHCLESPCCLTYLPQMYSFLVTEPEHNRVGVYEANFKFSGWMGYPEQVGKGTYYNYPTSVLSLANGFVALLEKHRLHIFDGRVSHLQSIGGVFHGLAEGPEGEIFTLSQNAEKAIFVKRLVREGHTLRSHYQVVGKVKLSVAQNFDNGPILSKTRFLTYIQGKIVITDLGLHKLYAINLVTGEQTASGYMGSRDEVDRVELVET